MRNRLLEKTSECWKKKRKLLCVYITLGYPNIKLTGQLIEALDEAGVDILELGFPFSDPLADGPTIQAASHQALKHKISIDTACRTVAQARKRGVKMPVIFFSYLNPILQYGASRFARQIRRAGFDGVIVPDLPPDEDLQFIREMKKANIAFVNLVAPTSSVKRMKFLAARSSGFVYYVSRRGVTGERKSFEEGIAKHVRGLRRIARKPVLIGFGISTPGQARTAAQWSDGVVVGSAIISAIKRAKGKAAPVAYFARKFSNAVHGKAKKYTRRSQRM